MRKNPHSSTKITFLERIQELKDEVKQLEELLPLHEYFSKCSRFRNSYLVEMRKIKAVELSFKGLGPSEIGRIFKQDHATILHLLKTDNNKSIHEEVKNNMEDWIKENKYPVVYNVQVPSPIHRGGMKTIISYKLKDIDSIKPIVKRFIVKEKKKSKHKGLRWSVQLQMWKVTLRIKEEFFYLGHFEKEKDAIKAINLKKEEWESGYI